MGKWEEYATCIISSEVLTLNFRSTWTDPVTQRIMAQDILGFSLCFRILSQPFLNKQPKEPKTVLAENMISTAYLIIFKLHVFCHFCLDLLYCQVILPIELVSYLILNELNISIIN